MKKISHISFVLAVILLFAGLVVKNVSAKQYLVNSWGEQRCPYSGESIPHYEGEPYNGGVVPQDYIVIRCANNAFVVLFYLVFFCSTLLMIIAYIFGALTIYKKNVSNKKLVYRIIFDISSIAAFLILLFVYLVVAFFMIFSLNGRL